MNTEKIPTEVLSEILCFLEPSDLIQIIFVSKKWELSVLSYGDRVWKSHFFREVEINELDEKEKLQLERIEGYFGKYSYFRNLFCFNFSKRFGCYVNPKYFHISKDIEIQNSYFHLNDENIFNKKDPLKTVFVGDHNSGKTSILLKADSGYVVQGYVGHGGAVEYIPTLHDNFKKTIDFNGKKVCLSFWDTAGPDEYRFLRPLVYPLSDVIVFCFAINDTAGLYRLSDKYLKEIKDNIPKVKSFVLCGCKTDLRKESSEEISTTAILSKLEILKVAKQMNASVYIETSASDLTFLNPESKQSIFQAICLAYAIGQCIGKKKNDSSKCFVM